MPPKKHQRTAKEKQEAAERKKKLLSTKEKVLKIKQNILYLVESMIEDKVSEDWLLNNCAKLCQSDYNDVVQERSIENLCGYALCSNEIKQTLKQRYRISNVTNKVYDVTERKCFCSNQCYKASNYLRAQLSPIPLYMRKEETIKVNLLSGNNSGSAGEEVMFHHTIPKEEIYKVYSEENSSNLKNMLNEELKKCADSLSGLQIKEHLFEKQYVFEDETPKKSSDAVQHRKSESESSSEDDSDDSLEEKLFPSYDNVSELSNRHMPIPEKMKKSVLIPPRKRETKKISTGQELSLDFVFNVFKDWMTEDTLKYLLGEKRVYGVKADHLFKTMTEFESASSEKLTSIKNEYIELCLKIDSLPDEGDISDLEEFDMLSGTDPKQASKKTDLTNGVDKRVFKRRPRKSKEKNKRVTFAPEVKGTQSPEEKVESQSDCKVDPPSEDLIGKEVNLEDKETVKSSSCVQNQLVSEENEVIEEEKLCEEDPPLEPVFPLIDSASQNVVRRQILTDKLKSVYIDLLPVAGLYYTDIREAVRKFISSLSLTPTNIIFKPKEWKVISLVLFRVLTRTVLKDLHDETALVKLCEDPSIPVSVDLQDIEKLVHNILSIENIINIPYQ